MGSRRWIGRKFRIECRLRIGCPRRSTRRSPWRRTSRSATRRRPPLYSTVPRAFARSSKPATKASGSDTDRRLIGGPTDCEGVGPAASPQKTPPAPATQEIHSSQGNTFGRLKGVIFGCLLTPVEKPRDVVGRIDHEDALRNAGRRKAKRRSITASSRCS